MTTAVTAFQTRVQIFLGVERGARPCGIMNAGQRALGDPLI